MKTRKPKRKPGKFWSIGDMARVMEVSQADIVGAARICGHAIIPGGLIWFPSRPPRDFIGEAHRGNLSRLSMEARRDARLSEN